MDFVFLGLTIGFSRSPRRSSMAVKSCGAEMSWAYILSGLLALAIFVYLVIALLWRRSSDDCQRILQLVFYIAVLGRAGEAARAYMAVSMKARRRLLNRWGAADRAADLSPGGVDPAGEMRWTQYALAVLWFTCSARSPYTRAAAASRTAAHPRTWARVARFLV